MAHKSTASSSRKYIFFYLTLVYIISFLIWWTYLLYSKTESYYEHKIDIELWKNDSFVDSSSHQNLLKKYQREKVMIITEGAVFLVILLILIYRVKKAVEQEILFSRQQQNFILSITQILNFISHIPNIVLDSLVKDGTICWKAETMFGQLLIIVYKYLIVFAYMNRSSIILCHW